METLKKYLIVCKRPHIFAIMCLGFSSGLPFLLIASTLPIWLKSANCSIEHISYIFLASLPYSLKFLWAPLTDQKKIPVFCEKLGQRRGWAFVTQILLFLSMLALGFSKPDCNIHITAFCAFLVSFFAATQDLVLDAYRIDRLSSEELGVGTSFSGMGFRLGMLVSGGGSVYLSSIYSWQAVYICMAFLMLIGPFTVLLVKEPKIETAKKTNNLYELANFSFLGYLQSIVKSFKKITRHSNWQYIILFIILFKISDAIPNSMGSMMFIEHGFSRAELGDAKTLSVFAMIVGTFVVGVIAIKASFLKNILFLCSIQILSPIMLYIASIMDHSLTIFYLSQVVQSFVCGIGSTLFMIYISSLCSGGFTATQFSIIYSFSSISRIILASGSGWLMGYLKMDWHILFFLTSLAGMLFIIPVLVLQPLLSKKSEAKAR